MFGWKSLDMRTAKTVITIFGFTWVKKSLIARERWNPRKQTRRNVNPWNDMNSNRDQEGMDRMRKEETGGEITSTMSSGSA